MQKECTIRVCSTCKKPLPWSESRGGQAGWMCCDGYYCSQYCLKVSFVGSGTSWDDHYSDDGDCCYTEWELEEV